MKKISVAVLFILVVLFGFMYLNSLASYTPFPGKGTLKFQQMQAIFGGLLFQWRNLIAVYLLANCAFSMWLALRRGTRKFGIPLLIASLATTLLAFGPGIHGDF